MSLYLSLLLMLSLLIFPPSPLSLFPSISLHIFPFAFSAHQRESPGVEDNPSSEQRVFHVLGRHTGESAASSLSSLQLPASASQHCHLSLFFSLPCLLLSVLLFSPRFMFSLIMEPVSSAGDVTNTASLCLDSTNTTQTPRSRSVSRCWSSTTAARAAALVFCILWMLLYGSRREVASEKCNADLQNKIVRPWPNVCKGHLNFSKEVLVMNFCSLALCLEDPTY